MTKNRKRNFTVNDFIEVTGRIDENIKKGEYKHRCDEKDENGIIDISVYDTHLIVRISAVMAASELGIHITIMGSIEVLMARASHPKDTR